MVRTLSTSGATSHRDYDGRPTVVRDGMVLNFTFRNWGRSCQAGRKACIELIAVHEFGHAIGYARTSTTGQIHPASAPSPNRGPTVTSC